LPPGEIVVATGMTYKLQGAVGFSMRYSLNNAVRRIVRELAKGRTWAAIADGLNADGVPRAQGGRQWYATTARTVEIFGNWESDRKLRPEQSLCMAGWSQLHDAIKGQAGEGTRVRVDSPARALGDSVTTPEGIRVVTRTVMAAECPRKC
jgi:hypothetical protein